MYNVRKGHLPFVFIEISFCKVKGDVATLTIMEQFRCALINT